MTGLQTELERPCCSNCLRVLRFRRVRADADTPSDPYAEWWRDDGLRSWQYRCVCGWEECGDGKPPSIASRLRRAGRMD